VWPFCVLRLLRKFHKQLQRLPTVAGVSTRHAFGRLEAQMAKQDDGAQIVSGKVPPEIMAQAIDKIAEIYGRKTTETD
jgi:hypothetical protein